MPEQLEKYHVEDNSADKEIRKQPIPVDEIQAQITSLIPLAGTIELTPAQEEILYAPVDEAMVEIRPDGLIYLPWMEYVTRLRKAFGMSWSLIPYGPPKRLGNFIHWAFWLIIRGKPYAFAVGEQQFFENDRITYGDALEGCKSNALMRVCKGLGISLELWQPEFRRNWLAKYAESYPAFDKYGKPIFDKHGKQKELWRKKGTQGEQGNGDEPPVSTSPPPSTPSGQGKSPEEPITEQQRKLIFAKLKEKNIPIDNLEGFMKKEMKNFNKFPDTNNALDWIGKQKAEK